ncbi:hypothetical protein KDL29_09110 [bacterium]|nr:hypothetical protein [bacterium]
MVYLKELKGYRRATAEEQAALDRHIRLTARLSPIVFSYFVVLLLLFPLQDWFIPLDYSFGDFVTLAILAYLPVSLWTDNPWLQGSVMGLDRRGSYYRNVLLHWILLAGLAGYVIFDKFGNLIQDGKIYTDSSYLAILVIYFILWDQIRRKILKVVPRKPEEQQELFVMKPVADCDFLSWLGYGILPAGAGAFQKAATVAARLCFLLLLIVIPVLFAPQFMQAPWESELQKQLLLPYLALPALIMLAALLTFNPFQIRNLAGQRFVDAWSELSLLALVPLSSSIASLFYVACVATVLSGGHVPEPFSVFWWRLSVEEICSKCYQSGNFANAIGAYVIFQGISLINIFSLSPRVERTEQAPEYLRLEPPPPPEPSASMLWWLGKPLPFETDAATAKYAAYIRGAIFVVLFCLPLSIASGFLVEKVPRAEYACVLLLGIGAFAILVANLIIVLRFHPWRVRNAEGKLLAGSVSWAYALLFVFCALLTLASMVPLIYPVFDSWLAPGVMDDYSPMEVVLSRIGDFGITGMFSSFLLLLNLAYFGRVLEFLAGRVPLVERFRL